MKLANPLFRLEQPDPKKIDRNKVSRAIRENKDEISEAFRKANSPTYLYWDKFKFKKMSSDLSAEELWVLISTYRDILSIKTPIKSKDGKYFSFLKSPSVDEYLHKIDMLVGGNIFPKSKIPMGDKEIFISRGIIEEAIASSQLEGAHTSRLAAKKLILENRQPSNASEQMIVNNYKAMLILEDQYKDRKLSRELLFEFHSILTDKTIDISEQKRFRKDSDDIVVGGQIGSEMYTAHVPPGENFLEKEIDKLIKYANNELNEGFIHPVIKAIFIHFWVGYLHPFTDGNGRLERTLFYWYLLQNGYWTFSYLPISTVIKKSPTQYAMAYIYSEQDSYDLTYFFDYHMKKILQSMDEFDDYVQKQLNQNKKIKNMLSTKIVLNNRQKQLLFYFVTEVDATTTTSSYATLNTISRQTAAKDLKFLENEGLIESKREGKYIRYHATEKLTKFIDRVEV